MEAEVAVVAQQNVPLLQHQRSGGGDQNDAPTAAGENEPPISLEQILERLGNGIEMYKIKSVQNFYRRRFTVDMTNMRLRYRPSSKKLLCSAGVPFIDLHDVEEVRSGWQSDVFHLAQSRHKRQVHFQALPFPRLREDCCFSLVLGSSETLNLIAHTPGIRDSWVRGLRHLVASCKDRARQDDHECWLREQFRRADVNNNGSLSFSECLQLLHTLNVKMDRRRSRQVFDAANIRKSSGIEKESLDPDEFVLFYKSLQSRPELQALFKKFSIHGASIWGSQELMKFLQEEQKMQVTLKECEALIESYSKKEEGTGEGSMKGFMTLVEFTSLLLSVDHDLFHRSHRIVWQDMTRPLNHYFIASSHNTYLIQGQMMGESSIEGYIRALKSGCRCLEIDIWDGPEGDPIVFHGHTLTSKIFLRDVIQAIKQYAFINSQFPVILSLENHCTVEQQRTAAYLFSSIFGDYLHSVPVGKDEEVFPSPAGLARKILIKAKKMALENLEEESEHEMLDEEAEKDPEIKVQPSEGNATVPKVHILTRQLSDLVNYCKATRFRSFQEVYEKWKFYEMCSFSEGSANSLIVHSPKDLLKYNSVHLSRIYPGALRVDSSNMEPVPYWNLACQMVALNYQSHDYGVLQNKAKFLENGGCGYVEIPPYLLDDRYDPSKPPHQRHHRTFHIRVISGQNLPKPYKASEGEVVDPYVTLRVFGHPLDCMKKKTAVVHNNGFNPVWNETVSFVVVAPELAVLGIQVKDNCNTGTNRLLATYALPCSAIATGFRHVHLWDDHFEDLVPATLFVHVKIE